MSTFDLRPICRVVAPLTDASTAPRQSDVGAPAAWLHFDPSVLDALSSFHIGDVVLLITWLDRADRSVLRVHPRGDRSRPQEGVFSTRSPHRPNPIGLHRVEITSIQGPRIQVRSLEALDGTPILDVKPVLGEIEGR
jgi:tRNA-Thr(GGU) m(6)t(6)A37 methyltransferase TsaA